MEFSNYPFLIIIIILVFYIFAKKFYPNQEISNVKQMPIDGNDFSEESEDEFIERCHNFLRDWFIVSDILIFTSSDKKCFRVGFENSDGSVDEYFIETYFAPRRKVIMFNTNLNLIIPDNKLIEISEFVNRLNSSLLVGSLYLNYETRRIENQLIYYVGNSELNNENINFNYSILVSVNIRNSVLKIIDGNENPALVALDWPN